MKKTLWWLLLVVGMSGCAQNHYNVPPENFASRVKVIGIAPVFIDTDSDIRYPQKNQLVQLVAEMNRKYESYLVRKLKSTGNFYAVTLLDGEPRKLFSTLLFRREHRDDATIQYNKYFWKNDELRSYIQKNNLDAVMLITVSGLTRSDSVSSLSLLASRESDYNFLAITSQILDANGTVLWEYPNFRSRLLTYYPLINLQYPDFSESEANLASQAAIKFKSLDGIRRTLDKKRKDWLLRETQEPEAYGRQFDEMISLLHFDTSGETKTAAPPNVKTQPQIIPPLPAQPQELPHQPKELPPQAPPVPAQPQAAAPAPITDGATIQPLPSHVSPVQPLPSHTPPIPAETMSLKADEIAPATGGAR